MAYIDYSEYSDEYDSRYCSPMSCREDDAVKSILHRYITPTSSVLDVGSGTGYLLDLLNEAMLNRERYLGIDANARMINKARRKHPAAQFSFEYASKILLPKEHFDVVASLFTIPYIGVDSIENICSALKDNGYFIAVYYNKPYRNKDSVYHRRKAKYFLTVYPQVRKIVRYTNNKMVCIEEGDLTTDKTYKYAVFMKGEI